MRKALETSPPRQEPQVFPPFADLTGMPLSHG